MKIKYCLNPMVVMIALFCIAINVQAKELMLVLKTKTQYPMNIHYKFSHGKKIYARGNLYSLKNNDTQYIAVNGVPDNEFVWIYIDKINVANRTVFNDPCKIQLNQNEQKATIVVGFKGNPSTHGSFTCYVAKN